MRNFLPDDPFSTQLINQIVLERVHIAANHRAPMRGAMSHAAIDNFMDAATSDLVLQLRTYIWGLADETIEIERQYPKDWWQALRERWFPKWWLKRYPVQYERISIHEKRYKAVCPHLSAESPDDKMCMQWLGEQSQ